MSPRLITTTGVLAALVPAALAASAPAATGRYVTHTLTPPASSGLEALQGLEGLRAVARARVVVPSDWRRIAAPAAGQLRFSTPGTSCRYLVTFSVATSRAATADPAVRAEALLPTPGVRRLLDSGTHGSAAFRVVRPATTGRVRVDGLRSAVLTRRPDLVATGQTVWGDLRATALSRPGDECHSGTWRVRMGPQLGDALAISRTTLAFVRVKS